MVQLTIQSAFDLAMQKHQAGNLAEAESLYRQIVAHQPGRADAYCNLAGVLRDRRDLDGAAAALQKALALRPNFPEAHNNLGNLLHEQGRTREAAAAYRQAAALRPDYAEAHYNLGNMLLELGELDESIAEYQRAITFRPGHALAHNNLANALKDAGRLDEAIASYRQAEALQPAAWIGSNLLYALHFHSDYDPRRIYQEHARWNEKFARPLRETVAQPPSAVFDRRSKSCGSSASDEITAGGGCATRTTKLRVGYVSPDFRYHPIGLFMRPLLAHHDCGQFEIYCYSDVRRPDALTRELAANAGTWRATIGMSDEQLDQIIRDDQIDILVDLTMHMESNRLLVFARKPAPVQATYLAYCGTTGLQAIDYRFTDPYLDPVASTGSGQNDELIYSEQSIYWPRTYWCYQPLPQTPDVGPLPALSAGHVTFGCLNNFAKVSAAALRTWCRVLGDTPRSVLVLHAREGSHRDRVRAILASHGIDPRRLRFVGMLPWREYLEQYQQIDIALDPFPYPGGTTTCDALWMGVPVVSLAGQTAVGRAGVSLLSNVRLPELVAATLEQYVRIAVELAGDLPRLAALRLTLRQKMLSSPLMDAPGFARDMEVAYREMWRRAESARAGERA